MAYKIQNSDAIKNVRDSARLSISEGYPDKLDEGVKAIIDVTPRNNRIVDLIHTNEAINATSATILTTSTVLDTYLTGVMLSVVKDATATSVKSTVNSVINGASIALAGISGLSLTAQNQTISISFPTPIKLDRGVTVTVTNSTNVANVTSRATIFGYTVQP